MREPAFTPGPWMRGTDPWDLHIYSAAQEVALVNKLDNPWPNSETWHRREANARLIAAAPALYEALGECVDKLWVLHFGMKDKAEQLAAINAIEMGQRALAIAQGRGEPSLALGEKQDG